MNDTQYIMIYPSKIHVPEENRSYPAYDFEYNTVMSFESLVQAKSYIEQYESTINLDKLVIYEVSRTLTARSRRIIEVL